MRAQRISSDGAPVGPSILVQDATRQLANAPAVAPNPRTGGWLVAFVVNAAYRVEPSVQTRRLDPSGAVVGREQVSSSFCPEAPSLVYRDRGDQYLLILGCGGYRVRRLTGSGAGLGRERPILSGREKAGGSGFNDLVYDPRRDRFLFVGDAIERVRTRLLDGRGFPLSRVRTLRRVSVLGIGPPSVALDVNEGRYLVIWSGQVGRSERSVVFTARLDARGVERTERSTVTAGADFPRAVSRGAAGGFLISYLQGRSGFVRSVAG